MTDTERIAELEKALKETASVCIRAYIALLDCEGYFERSKLVIDAKIAADHAVSILYKCEICGSSLCEGTHMINTPLKLITDE